MYNTSKKIFTRPKENVFSNPHEDTLPQVESQDWNRIQSIKTHAADSHVYKIISFYHTVHTPTNGTQLYV